MKLMQKTMIEQEKIPYTEDEIKAMVKTIEHLREENNTYKKLAEMNDRQFKELLNSTKQLRSPINGLKDLWHKGNEKPTRQIDSDYVYYALCIFWYDGWNTEHCKINKDGSFADSNGNVWPNLENPFFEYWAYVDDLIPNEF